MTPPPGDVSGSKPIGHCWTSWDDVPQDPHAVADQGPYFLELFAGKAGLTRAVQQAGVPVLPPVDIVQSEFVPAPRDILDVDFWDWLMCVIALGGVFFLHTDTPCNTYTAARRHDGGPPPLRSLDYIMGLPGLSTTNQSLVFLGNMFLIRTVEACILVFNLGGDFSIENPLGSFLWLTPPLKALQEHARSFSLDFDQCVFGAPSKKPTRLESSTQQFISLVQQCPGSHVHEPLDGQVWLPEEHRWVWRTKLAQVYPLQLCQEMSTVIVQLFHRALGQFQLSFALKLSAAERKRALGTVAHRPLHRQAATAALAQKAGYQLKRGAAKPLLAEEVEPGEAIRWLLTIPHPLLAPTELSVGLQKAIQAVAQRPQEVVHQRAALLEHWQARAHALLPISVQWIDQLADPALRFLLRGSHDHEPAQLGQVCHVALYEEMLQAANSVDTQLPAFLLNGFPIVGPIASSGRWPPYAKPQQVLSIQFALDRAWAIRKKIIHRVERVPVTENLQKLWDATMEDVHEGSSIGPLCSEREVTDFLQENDWIPTQRFEVVQKNKVRGCDSATTNYINQITEITEKLQLPSTDSNVAAIRALHSHAPWAKLAGWVLDERKAYRQVAVQPSHRKFSVICLKDPKDEKAKFFVMIGHSFGLVSAVYNYNRRSAAINEFLVSIFGLVAFSFYDDKYGFEPVETAASARTVAEYVHFWLGAKFDQKKLQLSFDPTILGVTYDLTERCLRIKDSRKLELNEEIDSVLMSGLLDPGSAGKLKGKLMFGASQLWGKVGRAFLRVISERQYMKFPEASLFTLSPALAAALKHWKKLIQEGPPRPIDIQLEKTADVVIFTDGSTPDPREASNAPDRVGAVMFDRRMNHPLQFTAVVPQEPKEKWIRRTTQIVPIEMLAPILALETFKDRVQGADIFLMIDSEAVEGALIKGYSSKSDICELVSIFWELALKYKVRIFIDRISTDANPADWPSRDDLARGEAGGWVSIDPKNPDRAVQLGNRRAWGQSTAPPSITLLCWLFLTAVLLHCRSIGGF